jgi:hypothetical protein
MVKTLLGLRTLLTEQICVKRISPGFHLRLYVACICFPKMLWFTKKKEKKKKNSDKLNLNIVTQNFHKGVYVYEEKTKQIAE